MKNSYYYAGTLIFYALIMLGSCLIANIEIVFNFASAISVTALAFVFPAWFYLKGAEVFGHGEQNWRIISYVFLGIGLLNFILGTTASIIDIVE